MIEEPVPPAENDSSLPRTTPWFEMSKEECANFLEFLFRDVARKPAEMSWAETGHVASYLLKLGLTQQSAPDSAASIDGDNDVQQTKVLLVELAKQVVLTCLQNGYVAPSTKKEALEFLDKHTGTYFTHPSLNQVRLLVASLELPKEEESEFTQSTLMSRSMQIDILGRKGKNRIQDDLSERIFVAYIVHKHLRISGARRLIAAALQNAGILRHVRDTADLEIDPAAWSERDVYDRVKKYEKDKILEGQKASHAVKEENRRQISIKWIRWFRFCRDFLEQTDLPK